MNLITKYRMPVFMFGITLATCLILLILPVQEILTTYKVVNGVKTVVFVPKVEGVIKLIASSAACDTFWILCRNRIEKKILANPDLLSYQIRKGAINFAFFCLMLLPSLVGVLSIVHWILGI